jgi:tRNA pseudouridine13 synthase
MKLKQQPEDFFVEELTDLQAGTLGEFALYRLEKRGWTTPDAGLAIRRRWKLDARRLSFGGLKDRHAHTIQYLTIFRGPQRRLTHPGFQVEYLGQVAGPFASSDIRANRFRLVLRSLSERDLDIAQTAIAEVRDHGLPNYFDDQRFSSVSGGTFVAKALVQGDFERALRLALTAPYEHDRALPKQEKAILNRHWGDWQTCLVKLPRGHTSTLVRHLAGQPDDFRGAIARLRPELRGLYLSAYQSHLWNRMLARWLREHLLRDQLILLDLRLGKVPAFRDLSAAQHAELATLELPLPTARGEFDPADPRTALMTRILDEEGLSRDELKVKGLREVFFSRGQRAAWCHPEGLQATPAEDDKNEARQKLTLEFDLPRGCYATLLVKRIITSKPLPAQTP